MVLEQSPEGSEAANHVPPGEIAFSAKGSINIKALRQEPAWDVEGEARRM